MEFVVQEAANKVLNEQLLRARHIRMKQVREQAIQWSDDQRRRFEELKTKERQKIAVQITEQVAEQAKFQIQQLLTAHDLAVAEVGAAHRAAAQLRELEDEKRLKSLEQQDVADCRGNAAIRHEIETQKKKIAERKEYHRRKEDVRKAEDKKSKELIAVSHSKINQVKPKPTEVLRVDLAKQGLSKAKPRTEKLKYHKIFKPTAKHKLKKSKSLIGGKSVVKYDTSIPKSTTNYTAPEGFGKKEPMRDSPNAWAKADLVAKQSEKKAEEQFKRQKEIFERQTRRGHYALKKAQLEKKLQKLTNELMRAPNEDEQHPLDEGNEQKSMLGLEDVPISDHSESISIVPSDAIIPKPQTIQPATKSPSLEESVQYRSGSSEKEKDDTIDTASKLSMKELEDRAKRQAELLQQVEQSSTRKEQLQKKLEMLKQQLMEIEEDEQFVQDDGEKKEAPVVELVEETPDSDNDTDAEGPYTSTPEGLLKLKRTDSKNIGISVSQKDLALHRVVSDFLERRVESLEAIALKVSSSSSSYLKMDTRSVTPSALSNLDLYSSEEKSSSVNATDDSDKPSPSLESGTICDVVVNVKNRSSNSSRSSKTESSKNTTDSEELCKSTSEDRSSSSKSATSNSKNTGTGISLISQKDKALHHVVSNFLGRRVESLEEICRAVSSSSSSNLRIDTRNVTTTTPSALSNLQMSANYDKFSSYQTATQDDVRVRSLDSSPLSDVIPSSNSVRNTNRSGSGTSSSSSSSNEKKKLKRSVLRNLVGDIYNQPDCLSPITERKWDPAQAQIAALASVFDQLKNDFAGFTIDKPPWLVS